MAQHLQCRSLPSSAELEVNVPAPGLVSWLKDPTKPGTPSVPAFDISGGSGEAKEIFYLAAPKRPRQPTGDWHLLKGSFQTLPEDLTNLEKTVRRKAAHAAKLYQSAFLLEQALHATQSWSNSTPISQAKVVLAKVESFAAELTTSLETGAVAAATTAAKASAVLRRHLLAGMQPAVVTAILQDAPLIHSGPNAFPEKALLEAEAKATEVYIHFTPAVNSAARP